MTHQSITDLIVFIRCRLSEDKQDLASSSYDGPIYDALTAILGEVVWNLERRSEPDLPMKILYNMGQIWSHHQSYRPEWKPID